MKHIEINIGNACNMKCLFCMSIYNKDLTLLVNKKKVFEKLIYYKRKGYNSLGFIGGEPTIHPYFLKFIAFAKKLGYSKISVVTNGFKFSNIDFFEKFILGGGNNIKLSFHCFDDKSGYEITGVPNIFSIKKRVLDNYNELRKKYDITLEIQVVINKINYKFLDKMIEIFLLYKTPIRLQFVGYYTDYPKNNLEKIFVSLDEVIEFLYKIYKKFKKYFIHGIITVSDIPICYLLNKFKLEEILSFLGDQYDYINEVDDIRNFEKFSFKDRKKNDIKYYPLKSCKNCKYYDICPGFYKGYFEILNNMPNE